MLTPSRRDLLSALVALSRQAERDDLPHAAWLLSCLGRAVVRGDERDLALAWCWLEAETSGTTLDVGELVGVNEAGGDGASAEGV
jgi:hypothetical protein